MSTKKRKVTQELGPESPDKENTSEVTVGPTTRPKAIAIPTRESCKRPKDWALYYAGICEWKVFPVIHDDPGGKKPPHKGLSWDKGTTDLKQIAEWWDKWPLAYIGFPTGDVNWIDVIDIDVTETEDGHTTIPGWEHASCIIVKTRSGGHHLWFIYEQDLELSNFIRTFKIAGREFKTPGVDTRTTGGYVILPDNRPDYQWHIGSDQVRSGLVTMSPELLFPRAIREAGTPRRPGTGIGPAEAAEDSQGSQQEAAEALMEGLASELEQLQDEQLRNPTCSKMVIRCASLIEPGLLAEADIFERFYRAMVVNKSVKDHGDSGVRKSITSAIAKGRKKSPDGAVIKRRRRNTQGFSTNDKGVPTCTVNNIRHALELQGVKLSYNEFSDQLLISGAEGLGPAVDDHAVLMLRTMLNDEYGFYPGRELGLEVVTSEALANRYHPVRDYLDALTWDGTERINDWLVTYGGAENTAFNRAVSRLMLVAAVRRIRKPGCKFDEMPVLESKQGTNKSSALRLLAVNDDWFSDSLSLASVSKGDDKKSIEQLFGKWIIEVPELQGMRESQVEGLKSFLSRQVDSARMSYARLRSDIRRQVIIVGTTNSDSYLHDETGNRRFWPVSVERFDLKALAAVRDQLWAEAAAAEASGESIRLDESLWGAAAKEQQRRLVRETWADDLAVILGDLKGKISQSDVWDLLEVPIQHRDQKKTERLRDAMIELDFAKKKMRFDGPQVQGFVRGEYATKFERDNCKRIMIVRGEPLPGQPRGSWNAYLEDEPAPVKRQSELKVYEGGKADPY